MIPKKLTLREALRIKCLECCNAQNVRGLKHCGGDKLSDGTSCPLFPFRMGHGGRPSMRITREECLKCMNGQRNAVKDCSNTECSLWWFRMGRALEEEELKPFKTKFRRTK